MRVTTQIRGVAFLLSAAAIAYCAIYGTSLTSRKVAYFTDPTTPKYSFGMTTVWSEAYAERLRIAIKQAGLKIDYWSTEDTHWQVLDRYWVSLEDRAHLWYHANNSPTFNSNMPHARHQFHQPNTTRSLEKVRKQIGQMVADNGPGHEPSEFLAKLLLPFFFLMAMYASLLHCVDRMEHEQKKANTPVEMETVEAGKMITTPSETGDRTSRSNHLSTKSDPFKSTDSLPSTRLPPPAYFARSYSVPYTYEEPRQACSRYDWVSTHGNGM